MSLKGSSRSCVRPTSAARRNTQLSPSPAWSSQLWFCPASPGSAGNDPARSPPARELRRTETGWRGYVQETKLSFSHIRGFMQIRRQVNPQFSFSSRFHLTLVFHERTGAHSRSVSGTARWPSGAPSSFFGWSGRPRRHGKHQQHRTVPCLV